MDDPRYSSDVNPNVVDLKTALRQSVAQEPAEVIDLRKEKIRRGELRDYEITVKEALEAALEDIQDETDGKAVKAYIMILRDTGDGDYQYGMDSFKANMGYQEQVYYLSLRLNELLSGAMQITPAKDD